LTEKWAAPSYHWGRRY